MHIPDISTVGWVTINQFITWGRRLGELFIETQCVRIRGEVGWCNATMRHFSESHRPDSQRNNKCDLVIWTNKSDCFLCLRRLRHRSCESIVLNDDRKHSKSLTTSFSCLVFEISNLEPFRWAKLNPNKIGWPNSHLSAGLTWIASKVFLSPAELCLKLSDASLGTGPSAGRASPMGSRVPYGELVTSSKALQTMNASTPLFLNMAHLHSYSEFNTHCHCQVILLVGWCMYIYIYICIHWHVYIHTHRFS
jgi:hypothetical protein